jgi:hypothetical protein
MLNRQEAMEAIDELTEYCRNCTPEQALQIEDEIRIMLGYLLAKGKERNKEERMC